ncbi:flagellar biosynthesis protein FlgH [Pigmentiphaga aceris]|uniref:Flagellar L-ring protein n=1 Tax=Pigmentiphaga aceris TaxID=1940612 RepID=A0A5C0AZU1_9BURK|nr:flagellar basal body L-ring protein FlgH [Pigmentiphaga aceris]QEI07216.1 flagellar biosynthesis protein FlgH [Pigmentiphaga aceris]
MNIRVQSIFASLRGLAAVGALLVLSACAAPKIDISGPTTIRPVDPVAVQASRRASGGIYADAVAYRPLFEDRRARNIGDTLVVRIEERIDATQRNNSSASRTGSASLGIPLINKLPFAKGLGGTGLDANSANTFDSKGATGASNLLTGTIAVTVMEVLGNGNLIVAGEKQLGTNQETERIRFSGVVNPASIVGANTVSSTQVADARIEYRGEGAIDSAQTAGWLTRFFFSFLPI